MVKIIWKELKEDDPNFKLIYNLKSKTKLNKKRKGDKNEKNYLFLNS